MLIHIITMRDHGKIGLTYHLEEMSTVCSKWFHQYCCFIIITILMTMEARRVKSEPLCRHASTKWAMNVLGGNAWMRHTCAASGSYPWSMDHHKTRSKWMYPNYTQHLKSSVLVFEENPGLCESWWGKQCVWSVKRELTEFLKIPVFTLLWHRPPPRFPPRSSVGMRGYTNHRISSRGLACCVWSVKDQCTEWSHMFPLSDN